MTLLVILQKFCATGHTEGDVRALKARRAALGRGQQGVHDVPQQAAPGSVSRQGAVLPWRVDLGQRTHTKQLEQACEKDKSVSATICRYLPLFHRTIQVHGSRDRKRVSQLPSTIALLIDTNGPSRPKLYKSDYKMYHPFLAALQFRSEVAYG